ncbi:hypothetical protein MNBD_GAMMA06-2094 [hydrothermal vent metagenome]|uniref:DUF2970 domain-containing protein n=1 Tax=hydrothermal vent metagenome TaxID=652676 RepID=A0A3B0WRM6_9ZZZZ
MGNSDTEKLGKQKKVSPLDIMKSVVAASFGVQTNANREKDFQQGKFHHFVIGGIVFAILFVLLLVGLVKLVLHFAGV